MSWCRACNSKLESIEYQARSADEATRITTTCPNCPVDASKIQLVHRPSNYARGLSGPVRSTRPQVNKDKLALGRQIWRVRVDCGTDLSEVDAVIRHVTCHVSMRRSVSIGSASDPGAKMRYQVTGTTRGSCESVIDVTPIGFGATLETIQLYRGSEPSGTHVCDGYYSVVDTTDKTTTYLYNDSVTNKNTIIVQCTDMINIVSAAEIVSTLYSTTCVPKPLQSYIQRRDISEYANLSPRAWDVSAPPKHGYKFTSKPDGERMWLVVYGVFWYGCECKGQRNIIKWWYNPMNAPPVLRPVVCDTEYVSGFGYIFIDSLTDSTGAPVPVVRDLQYSLSTARSIISKHRDSPLIIREYFDSNDEAERYSLSQPYPTDGTLGIRNGSTETVKIKSIKGADLLLVPGGALVTSDGDTVATISGYAQSYVGKVLEIRFTAKQNQSTIKVLDIFPRTNKTSPNSTEAVMNILKSCVTTQSTTDKERTMALKWCNSLCADIISRALTCDDTRHIVLDVGTGSGQSLDRLRKSDSVSFIYLEPDEKRAVAISKRSGARLITNPISIGSVIMSLKTRRTRHVVLNCSLQELLDEEELCKKLAPELKCVIATFSAQFVTRELLTFKDKYNTKVFGCTYTYDNAIDGVLVDDCGASMKLLDDDTAVIRWGSEHEYREPVTYQTDYYGLGTIVLGSDILPLPSGTDSDGPARVCKHIRVII